MNPEIKIVNARLPFGDSLYQITINEQGLITNLIQMNQIDSTIDHQLELDLQGDWLSLGGIDLQINGGLGLAFPDLEFKDIPKLEAIGKFLWQQGIDGFLPTIVTTSLTKIQQSLAVIAQYINLHSPPETATILGVHLEGPFLNYHKRGAHPEKHLLPLTIHKVKTVLGDYSSLVKIITLAPELDDTDTVIPYLHSLGIVVSLGHSLATAQEAKKAFNLGASMITHAFNAMPSLHHREPGLLGEAIVNPHVYCGLIADGIHVCPTMIKLLLEASNYEQGIFLVSDALSPMGLSDGIYPWDEREILVKHGTVKLLDGTLSGTTLPLLVGVENLVKWGICEPQKAISLATQSPRKALGLPDISVGQKANLLRWHYDDQNSLLTWQRLSIAHIHD